MASHRHSRLAEFDAWVEEQQRQAANRADGLGWADRVQETLGLNLPPGGLADFFRRSAQELQDEREARAYAREHPQAFTAP